MDGFLEKDIVMGGNSFFHGFSFLLLVNGKYLQGWFLYGTLLSRC